MEYKIKTEIITVEDYKLSSEKILYKDADNKCFIMNKYYFNKDKVIQEILDHAKENKLRLYNIEY